ncbi:MAG: hypothetical protein ACLFTZ_02165 [Acholeplasmataceae bacterium]
MRYRIVQIVVQAVIVLSYFAKGFSDQDSDGSRVPITGIEALVSDHYFIIGNIIIALVLLCAIAIILMEIQAIRSGMSAKQAVAAINIEIVSGLLLVTLLGTYLEFIGMAVVGLIVLGAFINYRYED